MAIMMLLMPLDLLLVNTARLATFDERFDCIRRGKPLPTDFARLEPAFFGEPAEVITGKPVTTCRLAQTEKILWVRFLGHWGLILPTPGRYGTCATTDRPRPTPGDATNS